ncbi:MAG: RHS repeat-associated core domain-containing protein, partial [Verrucomicrobiales bacterium]|nr:RHS repeat-associated core domain-containing protein [Verrucomicrobiales bacterium]
YEWDWADRLVRVRSNGVVVLENWYDAQSRRIAKKEVVAGQTKYTLYVWDGWDSVAVLDQTGQVMETHVRGVGLAGDIGTLVALGHHGGSWTNGTYYIHHNHRGDVVLTRSGTTTLGRYEYSAFGKMTLDIGNDVTRFRFSSKETESHCRLVYYGRRFYHVSLSRWLTHDPVHEKGERNLYSFVRNDPISHIDSLGDQARRSWGIFRWWHIRKCKKKIKCWAEECKRNIPNCDEVEGDIWEYIACLDRRHTAIRMCMEAAQEMIVECQRGANPIPPVKFPWEILFTRK